MEHPRTSLETAQDLLGWDHFLEGVLSTNWAATQHLYYMGLNKRNSGHRWLTLLIKKLWQIAWDIWDYRNDVNVTVNHQTQDQQITTEIQASLRNPVPASATFLLSADVVSPLQPSVPLSRKRAWLTSLNAHLEYDRRKRSRPEPSEISGMQKILKNFLQTT